MDTEGLEAASEKVKKNNICTLQGIITLMRGYQNEKYKDKENVNYVPQTKFGNILFLLCFLLLLLLFFFFYFLLLSFLSASVLIKLINI